MWKLRKNKKTDDLCEVFEKQGKAIALIDHELPGDEEDFWLKHIQSCEKCLALMAELIDGDFQLKHLAISLHDKKDDQDKVKDEIFSIDALELETDLPEDLYTPFKELLLAKGTRITPAILGILKSRGIEKVRFREKTESKSTGIKDNAQGKNEVKDHVQPIFTESNARDIEPAVVSQDFKDGFFFAGEVAREPRFRSQDYMSLIGKVTHREAIRRDTKQRAITTLENTFKNLHNSFVVDLKPVGEIAAEVVDQLLKDENKTLSLMDLYLFSSRIYTHSFNTLVIFAAIAKSMNFSRSEIVDAGKAALLHDIGRVLPNNDNAISSDIYRNHPMIGYRFLMKQGGFNEGKLTVVLNHHERYDGKGFPRAVAGEKLGLLDQIMILANFYDQAVTDPIHEVKREFHSAAQLIYQSPNILVSSEVTNGFLNIFGIYPPGTYVKLKSGEEGIVKEANHLRPFQPRITLLKDSKGQDLPEPIDIDMRELERNSIERAIDVAPLLENS